MSEISKECTLMPQTSLAECFGRQELTPSLSDTGALVFLVQDLYELSVNCYIQTLKENRNEKIKTSQ